LPGIVVNCRNGSQHYANSDRKAGWNHLKATKLSAYMQPKPYIKIIWMLIYCASCGSVPVPKFRHRLLGHGVSGDAPETTATDDRSSLDQFRIVSSSGWGVQPIVLNLEKGMPEIVKDGIFNAAYSWNEAIESELITINEEVELSDSGFDDRLQDGISSVYFEQQWCFSNTAMGSTFWIGGQEERLIAAADIYLNAAHYSLGDALAARPESDMPLVDIESLALHEIGHLLGLAHSPFSDGPSVMQSVPLIHSGNISRQLSDLDITRVRYIYIPKSPPPPTFPPEQYESVNPNIPKLEKEKPPLESC
jgi:hypothetical protein